MFVQPNTITDLVYQANSMNLYDKLIEQITKDFLLVNEPLKIRKTKSTIKPEKIIELLHQKVFYLIENDFGKYLNLLYIIDIPEEVIKKLDGTNRAQLTDQVVFLILKREWQKVWFKANY
jgi:hypothetical protein